MRNGTLKFIPLALALGLTASCGSGDDAGDATPPMVQAQRLVTINQTGAISLPGQVIPAQTDTVTLWLGPGVARRDVENGSLLMNTRSDRLTWLDHRNRTFTSQTGDELRRQIAALAADSLGVLSDDPGLDQFRRMLSVHAKVTDTGEESEFDGYHCRRWLVEQRMGDQTTHSELWLTHDIAVDWTLLYRVSQPTLAALPGGPAALAELARLDGFPVRSFAILEVMGRQGRTESRLVSVDQVEVPAGLFLPTEGYRSDNPSGPTGDHSR